MTSEKLRVIVIDDEDDIRQTLANTINESLEMEVVGQADSVHSAYQIISEKSCDALFLDIKIKGGDAFQLLRTLQRRNIKIPPVIINTGFAEFEYVQKAHNEFGEYVIMILKKPFWEDWAEKENRIIEKIRFCSISKLQPEDTASNIIIKQDNSTWFISLEELFLIETDPASKGKGVVTLHTKTIQYSVNRSLRSFEQELPSIFIRVSRYALVNIQFIERIDHSDQVLHLRGYKSQVGIGDAFKKDLMKRLREGRES